MGGHADNEAQRRKRLQFYEKNGFSGTGFRLSDDSGVYDILSSSTRFDRDEYTRLIGELGFGAYHPKLIPAPGE